MKEETGLGIEVSHFIDSESYDEIIIKWYLCHPITFDLKPGDDLQEVKFVPRTDVINICDKAAVSRWPKKVVEHFSSD